LDSKNLSELYYPKKPYNLPGERLDLKEDFPSTYYEFQLYCIERKQVSEEEAKKID